MKYLFVLLLFPLILYAGGINSLSFAGTTFALGMTKEDALTQINQNSYTFHITNDGATSPYYTICSKSNSDGQKIGGVGFVGDTLYEVLKVIKSYGTTESESALEYFVDFVMGFSPTINTTGYNAVLTRGVSSDHYISINFPNMEISLCFDKSGLVITQRILNIR
jgi:hypothetical protein